MIGTAYAQGMGGAAPAGGNPIASFIPLILIFVVFYFLLIRPQQKKEKDRKAMITALKKGDYVITTGGIYGTVIAVKSNIVDLKVDDNTRLQVSKDAIAGLVTQQAETTLQQ
jgi:preprotein translocase subunit YajC